MSSSRRTLDTLALHRRARLEATETLATTAQLARLGIRLGAIIEATQRTPGGGRVVAVGDVRIALDRSTARDLLVVEIEDEPVTAGPARHGRTSDT
ncbi:MAG: FeoA family protein [Dermatophilaceae bacterium]